MNEPRNVKLSTIFTLLKKQPIPIIIGFGFTFIPLFIVVIFYLIEYNSSRPDYDLINSKGKSLVAKITDIETRDNVKINDVNPTIISYEYIHNKDIIRSSYEVLEERKIENFDIGDQIKIKAFKGKTIIKGLKPYEFPTSTMFFALIPLLITGLPFLIYSLIKMNKELKLYKFGEVREGKIVSMIPKSGLPVSNIGQGIIVHYEYETRSGNKIIGESFTRDFSILTDKNKTFIPIFVLSENEKKSCIVPKLEALRNNWDVNFNIQ